MYQIYKDHDGITKGVIDTETNTKLVIKGEFKQKDDLERYAKELAAYLNRRCENSNPGK